MGIHARTGPLLPTVLVLGSPQPIQILMQLIPRSCSRTGQMPLHSANRRHNQRAVFRRRAVFHPLSQVQNESRRRVRILTQALDDRQPGDLEVMAVAELLEQFDQLVNLAGKVSEDWFCVKARSLYVHVSVEACCPSQRT